MHRPRLALLLLSVGVIITFVHDYAYRRVDTGSGEYELNGLLSHAGSDMLVVAFVLTLVALLAGEEQK